MKKAAALLLGLALVVGLLSACGPAGMPGSTTELTTSSPETQPPEPTTEDIEEYITEAPALATIPPDESSTTQPEEGFREPKTIKEAIDLYAAAVDKTLKDNPTINKRVEKVIHRPLNGDDRILRLLRISIAGYGVEKVICEELMGEGVQTYVERASTGLQPSWLRESDVTGFTAKTLANGDIDLVLRLRNCTDPGKPWLNQAPSPIGNVTWDFTNLPDIQDGIREAESTVPGLKINIAHITMDFYDIQVKATIRPDGSLASLVHSANQKVRLEDAEVRLIGIRLGGGDWGEGTGTGTITYAF